MFVVLLIAILVSIAIVSATLFARPEVYNADHTNEFVVDTQHGILANDLGTPKEVYEPGNIGLSSYPVGLPTGTINVQSDGSFIWTPEEGTKRGETVSFSYQIISDGVLSNMATVRIRLL